MFARLLLLAVLVPSVLLAACGDDDDDDTSGDGGGGASTTAPAGPSDTGGDDDDDGGSGGAETVAITAADFEFDTAGITVTDGATVTVAFINEGGARHSFTVGSDDIADVEGGGETSGTFVAGPDTTEFHCKYHSNMTGTITVEGASAQNLEDAGDPTSAPGGGAYFGY